MVAIKVCVKWSFISLFLGGQKNNIFSLNPSSASLPVGNSPPSVNRKKIDGTHEDLSCPPLLPDYQVYERS